ncbi:SAM-dependent methyltransferase [Anaeromyxobacter terrae]|uniref:SAM-dependent methyltransferase n=1 Tax=Anaeromyxobacter terrae TaxID=2925406 RepID=UPI001F568535|nr:class I SAM-dependent methyltransferase [Anaeromyxobacter sp. SG22]
MTLVALVAALAAAQLAETPPSGGPEVPFVTTPLEVVDEMLRLAGVGPGDVVYDLGCGDGRIVIRAARDRGAHGVGVDVDGRLVAEAREAAARAGVADRVEFREQDLFGVDLRHATVVTLYLFRRLNLQLRPKLLAELRPGARVVSHQFDMGDWKPDRIIDVGGHRLYLWTVPADPARRRALEAAGR